MTTRVLVVLNPVSGRGAARRVWSIARTVLEDAGFSIDVVETTARGTATSVLDTGTTSTPVPDAVIVCGGDGTIQEVVEGLLARPAGARPALGVLPGGTGNALLHDLGATQAEAAARRLVAASARGGRTLDVMRVRLDGRPRHALNLLGWGLAADAARRAERMRALGGIRYDLGALAAIVRGRRSPAVVEVDGRRLDAEFALLLVCNTKHTGKGLRIAPHAVLDDGRVRVIAVPRLGPLALVRLFAGIGRGKHLADPRVVALEAEHVAIRATAEGDVNLDGELARARSVELDVLPGAVTLWA